MLKIAVVGAGTVGLSSAVNIQQTIPTAQVTIIADKFGNDTTSNGAAGLFKPDTDEQFVEDRPMTSQWVKDSWEFYSGLAHSPQAEETGQTLVSGTVVYNSPKDAHYSVLANLVFDFHQLSEEQLKRRNLNYKYGYSFTTVVTQTRQFNKWLTRKFLDAGGSIVNKRLHSLTELAGQFDVVVNCCGLGARELVDDSNVFPVRGQVVRVHAPWMKHFFLSEDNVYVIPHDDRLIIGGTREENNSCLTPDNDTRDMLLKRAEAIFPELKSAKVLDDWVGLRPGRERVRFETETLDCGSNGTLTVHHNYGHGGQGISLGWGSGVQAAQVVHNLVISS